MELNRQAPVKENMENKRILELALETLNKRRADVEAAIQEVHEFLGGTGTQVARKPNVPLLVAVRRRARTAADRKRQSEKMKAYWAAKKASQASAPARISPTSGKRRPMTAAEKGALSKKLKAAWIRRKAAANK